MSHSLLTKCLLKNKRTLKTGIKVTGKSHRRIGIKTITIKTTTAKRTGARKTITAKMTMTRKTILIGRRTTRCSLQMMSKSVLLSLEDGSVVQLFRRSSVKTLPHLTPASTTLNLFHSWLNLFIIHTKTAK
jgi:hypothetical protein